MTEDKNNATDSKYLNITRRCITQSQLETN